MQNIYSYVLQPHIALDNNQLEGFLRETLKLKEEQSLFFRKLKQSIDARKKDVKINLEIEVSLKKPFENATFNVYQYHKKSFSKTILIVGSGPAGLFAALRCLELGIKPIVLERGKDVRARRRDIAAINKEQLVNPESNYCFGEGGAGTYSDGKLYTRSKKRGDVRRILEILVNHGATEQILVDAHPHIGTNKLPIVVSNIRETIISAGGEVHFDTKVVDFVLDNNKMSGVVTSDGKTWHADAVILATGHSARDIFEVLHKNKVLLQAKPFALGVRIEHKQFFVDQCQYHSDDRGLLPAASYSLVAQTYFKNIQRGVFSFCMCPGGFIVPSSTEQHELVVNGMSPSRRDSVYANSGVVVAVNELDWEEFKDYGPLAALQFQKHVEQTAYEKVKNALGNQESVHQTMPAQRIKDFFRNKKSVTLEDTSYQPGLLAMDFNDILPDTISVPLKDGLKQFSNKMKNYDQGQMIGIESRTSSPVRIPRDKETLEHLEISGFYPCAEGAGYAGGIVSAAMDGERCVEAFALKYL
ncbi:FAD-binding protein [Lacihabitans sp. LS3-19]|uniref:NAD(P)/FAD-dependent oxidoreductase n=1 Tax=Lacihabitans sp. LS3-19 TaxID=2487335 RepID=UPI0020CEF84D|nr:FAD-dependent oxidoreductase [Lacihabitans sp. LS3-19]MCP9767673.1 FAD-binding protein [Lacihabitans sp. LS3-19]